MEFLKTSQVKTNVNNLPVELLTIKKINNKTLDSNTPTHNFLEPLPSTLRAHPCVEKKINLTSRYLEYHFVNNTVSE